MESNPIKEITKIRVELKPEHADILKKDWGDSLTIPFEMVEWTVDNFPNSKGLIDEIRESYTLDAELFNVKKYGMFLKVIDKGRDIYEIVIKERV